MHGTGSETGTLPDGQACLVSGTSACARARASKLAGSRVQIRNGHGRRWRGLSLADRSSSRRLERGHLSGLAYVASSSRLVVRCEDIHLPTSCYELGHPTTGINLFAECRKHSVKP
jgi:hypothetical protein